MRIAVFDPFSGASGDMILGTLVDAGMPLEDLQSKLSALDLGGHALRAEQVEDRAVRGTRIVVDVETAEPDRTWSDIRALIGSSSLTEDARQVALAIFEALALAEAAAHGVPVDDVHFHEAGAVDSIVDICGIAIGLAWLGVERVYARPVRTGSGFVQTRHGLLPVPAPATAHLIAGAGMPVLPPPAGHEGLEAELLTPTAAAVFATVARFDVPAFSPQQVAHGFGSRPLPWPNALRLWVGDAAQENAPEPHSDRDRLAVLEANIDDMSPQAYDLAFERLFASGAVDVWLTPVQMKKQRPGVILSALAPLQRRDSVEAAILRNTTTLGVRSTSVDRRALERVCVPVTTRYGEVRLKLKIIDDRVVSAMPEYDDCAALARQHDRPFEAVWDEARRLGDRFIGLSQDQIG
jgi:pyridinium-3,5-bisthiocarboxylic acid mononucleotide nickel chelatase